VSRSSFEKPRPFERCVRTTSPSRYSTFRPRSSSSGPTSSAIVVLPAPESPVNQSVKPGRGAACPRSGPVEEPWGNREVPPGLQESLDTCLLREWRVDVDAALELIPPRPAADPPLLPRC